MSVQIPHPEQDVTVSFHHPDTAPVPTMPLPPELDPASPTFSVEAAYQALIDKMTIPEKMRRMQGLFSWGRDIITREVRKELGPDVSERRVRLETALRMYQGNSKTCALLQGLLTNESA